MRITPGYTASMTSRKFYRWMSLIGIIFFLSVAIIVVWMQRETIFAGLAISDATAWFGWLATILLTFNLALGVLQPLRYDPVIRWPHRRLPASIFKLHKWTGYTAIGVVLAHPLFLLWHATHPFTLSAIYIPFTAPAETLYAALGTIAMYLLLTVTLSSYFRERIGLELWKWVHYATYALLPVFLVHGLLINSALDPKREIDYFDAGKLIVETCALIAVAFVVWRLRYTWVARRVKVPSAPVAATPPALSVAKSLAPWVGKLRLTDITVETPRVKTFRFAPEAGGPMPFAFVAGQYFELSGIRNYTASSSPTERRHLEFSIKYEDGGFFSPHMHDDLAVGSLVTVRGPYGHYTIPSDAPQPVVMIAGGVGVTPSLSQIRDLLHRGWPGRIDLIYSTATAADVICADQLTRLDADHANFRLVTVFTNDGAAGTGNRITADFLRATVPDVAQAQVYVCGPTPMMVAVTAMLTELGVPSSSVFSESFAVG